MRQKLAYVLFGLSSFFKGLGKLIITKENTIVVDSLTLPGWFIVDNCMIYQRVINGNILKNGFEWLTWPMPDHWCNKMDELKRKDKNED